MRFRFGLPTIGAVLLNVPILWQLLKWLLDWKGRYDAGVSLVSWIPYWGYFVALLVGLSLIYWDRRRAGKKEVTVEISPFALATVASFIALGAWTYYLYDRAQGPITWLMGRPEYPIFSMRGGGDARPLITAFQFSGLNRYDVPIGRVTGKLQSNITKKEHSLYFRVNGTLVRVEETHGIPGLIQFMIIAPIADDPAKFDTLQMPADEFLSQFGDVTLSLTYDGHSFERRFRREELAKVIDGFERNLRRDVSPTITRK